MAGDETTDLLTAHQFWQDVRQNMFDFRIFADLVWECSLFTRSRRLTRPELFDRALGSPTGDRENCAGRGVGDRLTNKPWAGPLVQGRGSLQPAGTTAGRGAPISSLQRCPNEPSLRHTVNCCFRTISKQALPKRDISVMKPLRFPGDAASLKCAERGRSRPHVS
jgi:hypothetical protein